MKNIIKVMIIFGSIISMLLCGCASKSENTESKTPENKKAEKQVQEQKEDAKPLMEKGAVLYKEIDNKGMNSLETKMPVKLEVYDGSLSASFEIEDEAVIAELTSLFKNITVGDETEAPGSDVFDVTFRMEDSFYIVFFAGNTFEVNDEDGNAHYFELVGGNEFLEACHTMACEHFGVSGEYSGLVDYEGLKLDVGSYSENEDGDFVVEIQADNSSDNCYAFRLNPTVNGYDLQNIQLLIVTSQNSIGYYVPIATSVLKEYGIKNIGEVDFTVSVYKYDYKNLKSEELVFTSDVFNIKTDKYDAMDKTVNVDNIVYSDDETKFCVKLTEKMFYTNMCMYCINSGDTDKEVRIKEIKMNGEPMNIEGSEDLLTIKAKADSSVFAYFPLYNYTYDEATQKGTKFDIESLTLSVEISSESGETVTENLKIK